MIDGLIDQLKNKDLPLEDRFSAIQALLKFYDRRCLDHLKEILDDKKDYPEIRSAVALGLAKLGENSLLALKTYMEDENPVVRNYVIVAFGMIGKKALPYLVKALSDKDNEVFYNAADAIAAQGDDAVPYLTDLLENGKDDAKCVAAWKLGEMQATGCVPHLVKALRDDNNHRDVLALSTWALGEIARKQKNNKAIVAALYNATKSEDLEVKRLAKIALTKARDFIN